MGTVACLIVPVVVCGWNGNLLHHSTCRPFLSTSVELFGLDQPLHFSNGTSPHRQTALFVPSESLTLPVRTSISILLFTGLVYNTTTACRLAPLDQLFQPRCPSKKLLCCCDFYLSRGGFPIPPTQSIHKQQQQQQQQQRQQSSLTRSGSRRRWPAQPR